MSRDAGLAGRLALYLVADPDQTNSSLLDDVADALAGGVTAVQLRAKTLSDREALWLARKLRELCTEASALFIVNDRIDIALASAADGVHLGVDDLPLEAARQIGGEEFIIGYSPETDDQTTEGSDRGADYLGVGPVYGTKSKNDAGAAIGLDVIRRRAHLVGIPLIGIGGISADNATAVIESDAVGVAVVSSILRSDDPRIAASRLAAVVRNALSSK